MRLSLVISAGAIAITLAMSINVSMVTGQDSLSKAGESDLGRNPANSDDAETRERVIVLNSGRVMSGFASRNAGGWLVEQPNGRVQVPEDQVRVVGNSLIDTYRQQRDAVAEPTPASHVALAQWCISYRLHDEARDELRKCLKLDPEHSTARKLLRRLDDILDVAKVKPTTVERPPQRTADGFLTPDAESLGGLSNESAINFTQRIQPLLMNKCGNASCHGTTTPPEKPDGFHLLPVRSGANANRRYTERNLAEVMRYVDLQQPSLSPLMTLPQGAHGGTAGVFSGTNGNAQIKMLRTWIKTVAEEKRAEEAEWNGRPLLVGKALPVPPPSALPPTAVPRPLPVDPSDDEYSAAPLLRTAGVGLPPADPVQKAAIPGNRAIGSTTPPSFSGAPVELTAAQRHGQPLETVRPLQKSESIRSDAAKPERTKAEERPDDPFDPDLFNRKFHGRSVRSPASNR